MKIKSLFILLFFSIILFKSYYFYKSYNSGVYTYEFQIKNGDAGHYLKIAENIKKHGVYSDNNSDTPSILATFRPPLWPFTLAGLLMLSENLFVLILLKNFLSILLIIIAFRLFKNYNFKKNKYLALIPLLLLLEPHFNKYALTFLTEDLTSVFILLLSLLFINLKNNKYSVIGLGLILAITLFWHPISVFFVLLVLLFSCLMLLKKSKLTSVSLLFVFISSALIWPIRNHIIFKKGPYITISQGAALSKAWNKDVTENFTNVDGDLADETLNLKYVSENDLNQIEDGIDRNKLLTLATLKFISDTKIKTLTNIALIKLKSNFNPFPEKPKPGFLEAIGTVFRVIYLLFFIEVLILLLFFKSKLHKLNNKELSIVIFILLSQIVTAIIFYTGLRFNSIYALTLLYLSVKINYDLFLKPNSDQ
jgi:hypothetical protein